MRSELGAGEPDAAADGIDQDGVAALEPVDGVKHVIGGERLDGERRTNIETHAVGQLDQAGGGRDAFLGIGAALVREGGDAVADLDA